MIRNMNTKIDIGISSSNEAGIAKQRLEADSEVETKAET